MRRAVACGLIAGLLTTSASPRAGDKPVESDADDADFIEFLGSVDTDSEDADWIKYMAESDPTKLAAGPANAPPPADRSSSGGKKKDDE
jgi:hypothetical protein